MITHRNIVNFITGITGLIDFHHDVTILSLTTISFDIFVLETVLPLTQGCKVIIGNKQQQEDTNQLAEVINKANVNLLQLTPSRLSILLNDMQNAKKIFKNLSILLIGGEAFSEELLHKLRNIYKGKIYNMYGPTETTVWSSVKDLTKSDVITIGKPIANTQMYILRNLNIMPVGVPGELFIGGDGLAKGYWNNTQLSSSRFIPNPFISGQTIYNTGDIAKWLPSGEIEFLGRADYQVKLRGYRIELGEIEHRLIDYHEINEAVVIIKESGTNKYLNAYYTSANKIDDQELRHFLLKKLPEYMIPDHFIQMLRLPLTPNGNIDRKALPAHEYNKVNEFIPPSNILENELAEIWERILEIKNIGITDNFFGLGGNSMKSIRMISALNKKFNSKLDIQSLHNFPTIKEISKIITDNNQIIPIHKLHIQETYAISDEQFIEWLLYKTREDKNPNHIRISYEINQPNIEALHFVVNSLVQRHDILRSKFILDKGDVKLKIMEPNQIHYLIEEIDFFGQPQWEAKTIQYLNHLFLRPINIEDGPLFSVNFARIDSNKYLFSLYIHHIISDAHSNQILSDEIDFFYTSFINKLSVRELPEIKLNFNDFVAWRNTLYTENSSDKMLELWKTLSNSLPDFKLANSSKHGKVNDEKIKFQKTVEQYIEKNKINVNVPISAIVNRFKNWEVNQSEMIIDYNTLSKLEIIAQQNHTTMFCIIVSCVHLFWSKISGNKVSVLSLIFSTRKYEELNNSVGYFVNEAVLYQEIDKEINFTEFIKYVDKNITFLKEHSLYPFHKIIKKLDFPENFHAPININYHYVPYSIELPEYEKKIEKDVSHFSDLPFDLDLRVFNAPEKIVIISRYKSDLFSSEQVKEYLDELNNIIIQVASFSDIKINEILEHKLSEIDI